MAKTRTNNKLVHPGIDAEKVTRGRHPSSQVQAEHRVKEAEQAERAQCRVDGKQRVANLQMKSKHATNAPPSMIDYLNNKLYLHRQHNPWPDTTVSGTQEDSDVIVNEQDINHANSSSSTDSDYSDNDFEPENDEPDTELLKSTGIGNGSSSRGKRTWDSMIFKFIALTFPSFLLINLILLPYSTVPPKWKKQKSTHATGVLRGWENQAITHLVPVSSNSHALNLASKPVPSTQPADNGVHEGGIPSDDDKVEQQELSDK
ncbi:hypothetical protein BDQ17DRAFT_1422973 [Cyathus striatus]|nr:hypothetical protein BDQ17DRAFT_1422973 [Cyathus striatus]